MHLIHFSEVTQRKVFVIFKQQNRMYKSREWATNTTRKEESLVLSVSFLTLEKYPFLLNNKSPTYKIKQLDCVSYEILLAKKLTYDKIGFEMNSNSMMSMLY